MRANLIILALSAFTLSAFCQQPVANIKHKKCLLKGRWQLTKTEVSGSEHEISAKEFEYEIRLRSFHRYFEEVHYESEHWIIIGKWHVCRISDTLTLNPIKNIIGHPTNQTNTITFELFRLDKNNWAGSSVAGGLPVKVYYRRKGH